MKPSQKNPTDSPSTDELANLAYWEEMGKQILTNAAPPNLLGNNQPPLHSDSYVSEQAGLIEKACRIVTGNTDSVGQRRKQQNKNSIWIAADTLEDRTFLSGTGIESPAVATPTQTTEAPSTELDSDIQQETYRLSTWDLSGIESITRASFESQLQPLQQQQQALTEQINILSKPVGGGWGSDGEKASSSIGELTGSASPHGSYNVNDAAISPDRTWLVTAGKDKTARIIDQQMGSVRKTLSGHTSEVTSVDISADGKTIVTGSLDRSIKIWDAETGALKRTMTFSNGVQDVEFIDGTNLVAVGVKGSTIRTVDITNDNPSKSFGTSSTPHAFDEMVGQQTLVKNNGKSVQAYDPATGQLKMTYVSPMKSNVSDIDVSDDNQRTAAGARYGEVAIWNAQNGQRITSITTGQGDVTEVQWIDNNLLAVGHSGGAVCIFEINGTSVTEKARYKAPGAVSDIAADPMGTSIIVTTNSGTRGVFSFQTPGVAEKLEAAQNQRTSVQQKIAYTNTQINRAVRNAQIAAQHTAYQSRVDEIEGMVDEARPDPTEPVTTEIISRWRNDLVHIEFALNFTLNEIETDELLMGTNQRAELISKLTTLHEAINATFGEITGLETEVQRQQEEAAELAARQESVSALMMSVQQSLESQNSIGYARMEVTTEYNENAGYTRFVVRFRSPEDAVRLTAKVGGSGNEKNFEYISDHPGGTESEVWYFQLKHEENISGQVIIRLTDPVTGRLLDITEGSYSRGYPGSIATQQLPWDQVEQGRLEEESIAPSLSIVKIEGPNVIFSVQSPNDQSHVGFEGGEGLLSQTLIQHDGGTTFGMAMITFDAALPTGDYYLRMSDRVYGMRQDVVLLHWDKTSRTLSLTDQADALASTPPEGAEDMEAFQAMLNIDTASIADRQINWTEQQRMWEATYNLAAPYNFATIAANAESSYYDLHPQYKPENWQAEIDRRWLQDQSWTRGQVEDAFHRERLNDLHRYQESNVAYTEAMATIMQKAVDVYVQLQNGADQRTQLAQLDDCIRQNWAGGTMYGTNVGIPNRQLILEAGRQIFQNSWRQMVQAEQSYQAYLDACDYWREQGLRLSAVDGWVAITQSDPNDVPEEMSRREITLALKIYDTLKNSSDTRIAGLTEKAKLELSMAAAMRAGPDEVANVELIVFNIEEAARAVLENGVSTNELLLNGIKTYHLLKGDIGWQSAKDVEMIRGGAAEIKFTLTESTMVNFWVTSGQIPNIDEQHLPSPPNLTLSISGTGLGNTVYKSDKAGLAGESISVALPPGEYRVLVSDSTNYASWHLSDAKLNSLTLPTITVGANLKTYQSQHIEGRISIEGSSVTMPVSMSVAEYEEVGIGNWQRKETGLSTISALDRNKPVWVVVHGMDSRPDAAVMDELSKALFKYAESNNIQVVTVDWQQAAASGFIMTQDAPWTTAVGKWTAQQLISAGFPAGNINIAGWSHGTFVAEELAIEVQRLRSEQINNIVALDAARNLPIISGYHHSPNFAAISRNSIAFDSSIIAGDNDYATSAHYSYQIRSNELNPIIRHRIAVTTFTSILNNQKEHPTNQFSTLFSFEKIQNGYLGAGALQKNSFNGGFEGLIDVSIDTQIISGENYYKANPSTMRIRQPNETTDTILIFDSIQA